MPPAARITDMHVCPMVTPGVPPIPHVGGPILPPGAPTVLIGFLPAARMSDMAVCVGPPDVIAKGSAGVFINFLPAARMGDTCAHGGTIILGEPTVMIGEIGSPSPGGGGAGAIMAGLVAAGVLNPATSGSYTAALNTAGTKGAAPGKDAPGAAPDEGTIQLVSDSSDDASDPSASPAPDSTAPAAEAAKGAAAVPIPPECAYLKKQFRAEGDPSVFDPNRRKASVGDASPIKFTFPGSKVEVDATSRDVTIGGHSVTVIAPTGAPGEAGTVLPSIDQVASSLGAVPGNQFGFIKRVVLSPDPNPADAYWAKQYNMPNFRSEATAGADGIVDWYPIPKDASMIPDETMIHESGHAFSKNIWPKDADWKPWTDAMAADGRAPSDYAESSKDEDFSESLVMYSMSKGTKCEATAKALYPNRYAILDKVLTPKAAPGTP